MLPPSSARLVRDIDWAQWSPTDHATLLFVIQGTRILLIRKKRGLGAGKISGPGGRLDPGETAAEAAVRELQEELLIHTEDPTFCGEHFFQFTDGYGLHVTVFKADHYEGEPTETDEAIPLWFDTAAIPYEDMWEDDRHWFPHMLSGRRFCGRYIFDGEQMLDMQLDAEQRPQP
jgi:8-oxo-dGTP diphosphatase